MEKILERILIARVDRIGDLILTLPMESALKALNPQSSVTWLVEENLRFVMESVDPLPRTYFTRRASGFSAQLLEMSKLVTWLKEEKFTVVYGVHLPWWIALSFWRARIPVRIGVASQWFSFLFYNHRIRQRRSQALKNEGQYNLELISGSEKSPPLIPATLIPNAEKTEQWRARLGEGFVVIHPGMAGSARNWPLKNYRELADKLIKRGNRVLVTGSLGDKDIVHASGILNINGVENYLDKTHGADLLSVLSLAKAIVAPSTGVAHLGASLGKKVIGLYSPVKVQSPVRWSPQGKDVKVFSPKVECPGVMMCLGEACKYYDCMEKIEVDSVVNSVMERN